MNDPTEKWRRRALQSRFSGQADRYDQQTEWRQAPEILNRMADLAGTGDELVADLGTGTGLVGATLRERGWTVIGIDLVQAMLARARTRLPYPLIALADALPLRSGSVGGVTVRQLLHYGDDRAILAEALRITKPGGWLVAAHVVTQSQRAWEWWTEVKSIVQPLRLRNYTAHTHRELVEVTGWTVIKCDTLVLPRSDTWEVFLDQVPRGSWEEAQVRSLVDRTTHSDVGFDLRADEVGITYGQGWQIILARRE